MNCGARESPGSPKQNWHRGTVREVECRTMFLLYYFLCLTFIKILTDIFIKLFMDRNRNIKSTYTSKSSSTPLNDTIISPGFSKTTWHSLIYMLGGCVSPYLTNYPSAIPCCFTLWGIDATTGFIFLMSTTFRPAGWGFQDTSCS